MQIKVLFNSKSTRSFNKYKYFAMNSALMVQLLLSDEEKQGIYDLGLAGD